MIHGQYALVLPDLDHLDPRSDRPSVGKSALDFLSAGLFESGHDLQDGRSLSSAQVDGAAFSDLEVAEVL